MVFYFRAFWAFDYATTAVWELVFHLGIPNSSRISMANEENFGKVSKLFTDRQLNPNQLAYLQTI